MAKVLLIFFSSILIIFSPYIYEAIAKRVKYEGNILKMVFAVMLFILTIGLINISRQENDKA